MYIYILELINTKEQTRSVYRYIRNTIYKITNYEAVNENIIKINTALNNKPATIWGVYDISNNELCNTNHKFFKKVNNQLMKIRNLEIAEKS